MEFKYKKTKLSSCHIFEIYCIFVCLFVEENRRTRYGKDD